VAPARALARAAPGASRSQELAARAPKTIPTPAYPKKKQLAAAELAELAELVAQLAEQVRAARLQLAAAAAVQLARGAGRPKGRERWTCRVTRRRQVLGPSEYARSP
jgi:hypothetical protein